MTLRVRVPATTANLGPGFDCVGVALDWYDELELDLTGDDRLVIEVEGEGAGRVPTDEGHLVVASLLKGLSEWGGERPRGMVLRCRNTIPHARGLGSSAAAIVAGLTLAQGLAGAAEPDRQELTRVASLMEGHPDNAGAAVHGGAVLGWIEQSSVELVNLPTASGLLAHVYVPSFEVPTSGARSVLPDEVPRTDAVQQAIRAALLPLALASRPDLLLSATADRLHQPYRAGMMAPSTELMRRLRDAGVPAAISGAGPSVLAIGTSEQLAAAEQVDCAGFTSHRVGLGQGVSLVLT